MFSLESDGTFLGDFEPQPDEEKDALLFHGIPLHDNDEDDLENVIRETISKEYGINCKDKVDTVRRLAIVIES